MSDVARMARADGMVFRRSRAPVPKATGAEILQNRIYTGKFDWDGKTYDATYQPIISPELWDRVQEVSKQRLGKRRGSAKHQFPYSGLISCGHCGCALVGEIKKGRYVYYHCIGYKGKCPEPYTPEHVLEAKFSQLLQGLTFDEETIGWVKVALQQSHAEEREAHDEAVGRLHAEYNRLQQRIDAAYADKLDGKITVEYFETRASEWRNAQAEIGQEIGRHSAANTDYMRRGIELLDLARRAIVLFRSRSAVDKRRLLSFVLSNCVWKDGELSATYRQPFDMIAVAAKTGANGNAISATADGVSEIWLLR